jgi:hypothetical protein
MEPLVQKDLLAKTGTFEGSEHQLNATCRSYTLVWISANSLFLHRVDALYNGEGTWFPVFCTHSTFTLEQVIRVSSQFSSC